MPIVSISEAARLTGKARSTIQTYIKTGKLSKNINNHTGNTEIEISELIRVFGKINVKNTTATTHSIDVAIDQQTTEKNTVTTDQDIAILQLKLENERLKSVLEAKQEIIDTLKTAFKLLEYRQEQTETVILPKKPLKNPAEAIKDPKAGFWGRLKKLFL